MFESQSTWLVKTDMFGNIQWNRTYPGHGSNSVIKTNDGGYAFTTEYLNAFGLIKIDASGQMQWNQAYDGPSDEATTQSVIQTSDGGFGIAGWTMTNSTGVRGAWLVKTDLSGNVQWSQTYGGLAVYSLIQTSDGGYAMTGDHACLIITDSSGNIQWSQTYDSYSEDRMITRMYSLIEASANHFVMAGVQNVSGTWVSIRYDASCAED